MEPKYNGMLARDYDNNNLIFAFSDFGIVLELIIMLISV